MEKDIMLSLVVFLENMRIENSKGDKETLMWNNALREFQNKVKQIIIEQHINLGEQLIKKAIDKSMENKENN